MSRRKTAYEWLQDRRSFYDTYHQCGSLPKLFPDQNACQMCDHPRHASTCRVLVSVGRVIYCNCLFGVPAMDIDVSSLMQQKPRTVDGDHEG